MKRLVFLIILFVYALGNTQEKRSFSFNNTSLNTIIKELEKHYAVSFSYAVDLIKDKNVTCNTKKIELDALLVILESETALRFEKISENQIIISPKENQSIICGYILDKDNNKPIPNALIQSSTGKEVLSNSEGFFTISGEEQETYEVSSIGYATQKVIGKKTCPNIYLVIKNEQLDEVIISGYVTTGMDRQKDGAIQVNSNSLGILPGLVNPDLLQSIQLIPGINSPDESTSGIQIRGGSPDQNLILFDDIKLFNTGFFYGMFSTFNPYATKKATIFKSGSGAAYGDRISGVIDISTGEDIPQKTESGFGLDGISIDGYIRAPLSKKLGAQLFIRRSYNDILNTPTSDSYAEKVFRNFGVVRNSLGQMITVPSDDEFSIDTSTFDFSFHDINTKLIYTPNEKNKFIFSGILTRNDLDFSFHNDGTIKIDDLATVNSGLSIKWNHKSSEHSYEDITFYISGYRSEYLNEEIVDATLDETNIRNNFITETGLNLNAFRHIGKGQNLAFGYQISNSHVDIEIAQLEELDEDDNINLRDKNHNLKNAMYFDYKFNSKNTSLISLGLRAVNYRVLRDIYLEPRINLEYKINKAVRIKSSLERRYQPISQIVEFNQGELRLENSIWQLSNRKNSPILKSDQVSAGLLFDKNNWTIDFDAYYKRISGLTSATNGFSTPTLKLDEGKSNIKGIDVLVKKRINNYRVWAGYTYNDVQFNFPKIQPENFPGNNDITHNFRISNTLRLNTCEISLGWQYRTGAPYTPIVNFDPETSAVTYGKLNSERLKDYHKLDASVIYNFKIKKNKNWKTQLGISALNIYNRKTPLSYTYISENEDGVLKLEQVIQRFSLGFTPNISFRLFF
ncbi:FecR domain-containing protein [Seonamhaeicola marinus]|uniref:TonB-dependent receptor plug domain-containing protein n=1 Tax=Seonamhaeicola marinus TaxID=1912246 RepID=A0A5D0I8G5_9FLAO|nr:FecR domain-containing protein [Seonamhaeicola marinus]TYA78727.1 TonB-dependent receptor plug domain-containing protein [Seonamhaeicola marinus]